MKHYIIYENYQLETATQYPEDEPALLLLPANKRFWHILQELSDLAQVKQRELKKTIKITVSDDTPLWVGVAARDMQVKMTISGVKYIEVPDDENVSDWFVEAPKKGVYFNHVNLNGNGSVEFSVCHEDIDQTIFTEAYPVDMLVTAFMEIGYTDLLYLG